jgi:hypothetical protein
MRYMKIAWIAASVVLSLFIASNAEAISVSQPPLETRTDMPVIVTGYAVEGSRVLYVQLFNSSNNVVDVSNWTIKVVDSSGVVTSLVTLQGLLKPEGYLVIADTNFMSAPDIAYTQVASGTSPITSLLIEAPSLYLPQTLTTKNAFWRRNISTTTGNYLSTFSSFTPDSQLSLYGGGFYEYPSSTTIEITEILANPRVCSPLDSAGDCMDYIKIYNPSVDPVDLSYFRARVGYLGQAVSSGNTFQLEGLLQPGHFAILSRSADDRPINLGSSGNYVWLEDTYGLKRYDSTVLEYPDASADSKKGQAWAYDNTDGTWKWTIQPSPFDGPSVFPILEVVKKPVTTASLAPCKEGLYRSEETNRCRSLATNATVLAPCDDDEERNPDTNRCRKTASLASQQLTPCKEGQERNTETNRCRNVADGKPPEAGHAIETVGDAGKSFIGWWAAGGIGILGLGYGAWEWRREALGAIQKIGTFFTSHK